MQHKYIFALNLGLIDVGQHELGVLLFHSVLHSAREPLTMSGFNYKPMIDAI
jgi:hypothetical protein